VEWKEIVEKSGRSARAYRNREYSVVKEKVASVPRTALDLERSVLQVHPPYQRDWNWKTVHHNMARIFPLLLL
jgi:hypothetical protein